MVKKLDGLFLGCDPVGPDEKDRQKMGVEIRWKGPKIGLGSFRRTVKKNVTKEVGVDQNGVVEWDEEFFSVCGLSGYKDDVFHPWEISFTVLNVSLLNPSLFIYLFLSFIFV